MKILIDTHIAIWAVLDDPKLSKEARNILLDSKNEIYYSTASVWEITIKHMAHPETFLYSGHQLAKGCAENGFIALPIMERHVFALETLKRSENAPAKAEDMKFLTHDAMIPYYNEPCAIQV